MVLRVCIPTAGTGSRLNNLTQYLNKSLVSVANRPILSHLIDQFPEDTEFVIALGYKGNLVREFLELAYPNKKIYYANVVPYEGSGSGLGWSLLQCKKYLQQPFIFLSCDTLVRETIPLPTRNWIGYAERDDLTSYRTLFIEDGSVKTICEKGCGVFPSHKAYIGLAGIADYKAFWDTMESGGSQSIEKGESYGLQGLTNTKIEPIAFTWFDTGNLNDLELTRHAYQESNSPNILEKSNESIWFLGDQVIKFSDDETFIANRVMRATEIQGFVPTISGSSLHMYRYPKISGKVLSEVITLPLFKQLLQYGLTFWKETKQEKDKYLFRNRCLTFYKNKTQERVALFFHKFQRLDGKETINGVTMPTLGSLLQKINWDWISDGQAGRFHGDFHFENILWTEENQSFTFLDWRQDFGGSLTTGDVYYDLAKLMHGLIICHELIAQNHFYVLWEDNTIRYDFHRKQILVECECFFEGWLLDHGYDVTKVRVLTALIYLNIAALHHYPYSLLLFALGKSMLQKEMEKLK